MMEFFLDVIHLQALGSVVLLCSFLVATTVFQQRALQRSRDTLQNAANDIKFTVSYASAQDFLDRRQAPSLFFNPTYAIPAWFLILVVLLCSVVTYFGAELMRSDTTPSFVLGGVKAAKAGPVAPDLAQFQAETLFTSSIAFLGAYVWLIANLMTRLNNYDTSPVTYYFMAIRVLSAFIVAGIARLVLEGIPLLHSLIGGGDNGPVGLAVLGFAIGWNPALWIDQIGLWIADFFKSRIPQQRWPQGDDLPENKPLSMIEGMLDSKINRLMELDIDNAQRLACENSVLIWLRTSYNLETIVDWIAQAQLYRLLDAGKVRALRANGIRDIFGYMTAIADDAGIASVHAILNVSENIIGKQRAAVADDPAFQRLGQVKNALKVRATPTAVAPHHRPVMLFPAARRQ
jgi:hypothetical protein